MAIMGGHPDYETIYESEMVPLFYSGPNKALCDPSRMKVTIIFEVFL